MSNTQTSTSSSPSTSALAWAFPPGATSAPSTVATAKFGPLFYDDYLYLEWTPSQSRPRIDLECYSESGSTTAWTVLQENVDSSGHGIYLVYQPAQRDSSDTTFCFFVFANTRTMSVVWQYNPVPGPAKLFVESGETVIQSALTQTFTITTVTALSTYPVLLTISSTSSLIPSSLISSSVSASASTSGPATSDSVGLSTGQKAGIGVGVAIGVLLLLALGVVAWLWTKKRRNRVAKRHSTMQMSQNEVSETAHAQSTPTSKRQTLVEISNTR